MSHAGSMSELIWDSKPELERPLLIMAFGGWFDAGTCATDSVGHLSERFEGERIAEVDPEEFFDFQEVRPEVAFTEGGEREIRWPSNEIHAASTGGAHDLLLLAGVEPRLKWRTFVDNLIVVMETLGVEMVITLGAMVAAVPHTRPARVTASSGDPELARRLGLDQPSYQGPTGIVGVIHQALGERSIPAVSLRVGVPHYVSGPSNPKGRQALLAELQRVTGVETGHGDLAAAVLEWEERVGAAVAGDPEVAAYVRGLEEEADSRAEDEIPTGEHLAAEFERFLRDLGD